MTTPYFEPFPLKTRGDLFGDLSDYRQGRPHRGQDWSPKANSAIKAITSGTVFINEWSDGLGWFLVHSTKDHKFVLYAHLAKQSALKKGAKVEGNFTLIGLVGDTGQFSTGAHLHLSIAKANKAYSNPEIHLAPYSDLVDPLKHIVENKGKK